jgi:Protein of unknown function (DUF3141)
VLFWDAMRQRGDNYLANLAMTTLNGLKFDCTLVADGRKLPRPVNYGLVRITPPRATDRPSRRRPSLPGHEGVGFVSGIGTKLEEINDVFAKMRQGQIEGRIVLDLVT